MNITDNTEAIKALYSLKALERMYYDYDENFGLAITRIPGGWMMEDYRLNSDGSYQTLGYLFIPYSDEFLPSTQYTVHKKISYTK